MESLKKKTLKNQSSQSEDELKQTLWLEMSWNDKTSSEHWIQLSMELIQD